MKFTILLALSIVLAFASGVSGRSVPEDVEPSAKSPQINDAADADRSRGSTGRRGTRWGRSNPEELQVAESFLKGHQQGKFNKDSERVLPGRLAIEENPTFRLQESP